MSGPDELLADLRGAIDWHRTKARNVRGDTLQAQSLQAQSHARDAELYERCRDYIAANAALAARCVPREPTEAMIAAAFEHWSGRCSGGIAVMWQAMYDAALAQESESKKQIPTQAEGETK